MSSTPDRDPDLAAVYRELPATEPPVALDDAILAAARREAGARPRLAGRSATPRWMLPLSLAAVLVVSGSLVLVMKDAVLEDPLERPVPASGTARTPTPSSPPIPREAAPEAERKTEAPDALRDRPMVREVGPMDEDRFKGDRAGRPIREEAAARASDPRSNERPMADAAASAPRQAEDTARAKEGIAASERSARPGAGAEFAQPVVPAPTAAASGPALRSAAPAVREALPVQSAQGPAAAEAGPASAPAASAPAAPRAADLQRSAEQAEAAKQAADRMMASRADRDRSAVVRQYASGARPHGDIQASPPGTVELAKARRDEARGELAPEEWLRRIEELQAAGRVTEAAASLAEFRKRYPDHPLPPGVRELLPR